MKASLFIVLGFCVALSSCSSLGAEDVGKLGLKGKVKTVHVTTQKASMFASEADGSNREVSFWNEEYEVYNFDENGRFDYIVNINPDADNNEYDENGNLTRERSPDYEIEYHYAYNKEGGLTYKLILEDYDSIQFYFNKERLLIKEKYAEGHKTYTYNDKNILIHKVDRSTATGRDRSVWWYNDKGDILKECHSATGCVVYTYNANDLLVADTTFEIGNESVPVIKQYSYDGKGELVNIKKLDYNYAKPTDDYYESSISNDSIVWSYDEQGNWISKKHFSSGYYIRQFEEDDKPFNNMLTKEITREITYY